MVAGTTTTALILAIGAFAICVLPWFRSKSRGNEENQEVERIEMTVDPGSPIEENSTSSSTGFGRIFLLRAFDWVRAAMISKSPAVTSNGYGATENKGNAAKIQIVGKLFREENSTIERPILMAQRFNQFQSDAQISKDNIKPDVCESYELIEILGNETRTMETPGSVTASSKKYSSRDSVTLARREPAVAHSTWKNIGPLLGSSIYSRQRFQKPNYEDPRITKESSLNLREAHASRIEEIPLDLSVQTASRLHAENSSSSDIPAENKSARPRMREESSSFIDENGNDGGSGLKRKVFRDMLDFLRLKEASRKRHKASELSDSIKFCQVLSSSFPTAANENTLQENKRKNISTGPHEILELKNSETSADRGFSRKFKKIFDPQIHWSAKITRLDVKQKNMNIIAEPIQNTSREEICFLNNNCVSTSPKVTEFENISYYIEPCTEL